MAVNDWYERGLQEMYKEASEATDMSIIDVQAIYAFLLEIDLIDYDNAKEIIFDRYESNDD